MADHTILIEAFYGGTYNDISDQVREGTLSLEQGPSELGDLKPSMTAFTLEDPSGQWHPLSPTSPLYGKIGRALPVRVTVDGARKGVFEAVKYEPDQSVEFTEGGRGRRWVNFRAEGMLRRIGRWTSPLRSPMFRQISSYSTLVGYWPLEDAEGAESMTNALGGGVAGLADGVEFGQSDAPAGASSTMKWSTNGVDTRLYGKFKTAPGVEEWQICLSYRFTETIPVTASQILSWNTSNGNRWVLNVSNGSYTIATLNSVGTTLGTTTVGWGLDPSAWTTMVIAATVSGGTVTMTATWYAQGAPTFYTTSYSYAGTTGYLTTWRSNGNPATLNGYLSHVFGTRTTADTALSFNGYRAFDGYVGETAGARFARLCNAEGVPWSRMGANADTLPMGRQVADTFLNLIREVAETDQAMIFDRRSDLGLTLRTRRNMYDQAPALELTYPDDIAPPFQEVIDDQGVANVVTVKNRYGGEATLADDSSDMGTQAPPAGVGEYRKTVDVSLSDDGNLPLLAGWHLANGTLPGARYPQVTVDLDARPSLTADCDAVLPGDIITITGRGPDVINLLVLGISDPPIGQKRRTITFTCIPADVWQGIGKYDAARYDSSSTTLAEDLDPTETGVDITTALNEPWDTATVPYDVQVGGEVMRCTAVTAPAGSGPYTQTMTVTRSVNGVIKSHSTGDRLRLAAPQRYAL
jgi:hypothetical protein